jgi:hypothetical protein
MALLEDRALFFPRASTLNDAFEGSFPEHQSVLDRVTSMLPPEELRPGSIVSISPGLERLWATLRTWTAVSCWHVSEYESAAMWRLYSANDASVAILSTVGRLRQALGQPPAAEQGFHAGDSYQIGLVEYIDYSSDRIPAGSFLAPLFRKRRSFEHERELRATLVQYPISPQSEIDHDRIPTAAGVRVPIDINHLIAGVRVSPASPIWFADLVRQVAKRYELLCDVVQSEIDATPLY